MNGNKDYIEVLLADFLEENTVSQPQAAEMIAAARELRAAAIISATRIVPSRLPTWNMRPCETGSMPGSWPRGGFSRHEPYFQMN